VFSERRFFSIVYFARTRFRLDRANAELLRLAVARLGAVRLAAGPGAANCNLRAGLKLVLSVSHYYFSGLYTL
jgi:hypothetical protein